MMQADTIESLSVVGTKEFSTSYETLLNKATFVTPKSLVYTNILDHNQSLGRHLINDVYVERVCNVNDISICQMPRQTTVYGGIGFLTGSKHCILADQVPPYLPDHEALLNIIREPRDEVAVSGPHLLVARYGEGTWGHWLVDLLPKIVIAEAFFPGRFQFVVPDGFTHTPSLGWRRMLESLHAYGISGDRLLGISPSKNYVFDDLSAVTPIWSAYTIHPAAHDLMNRRLALSPLPPTKRVAMMRTDSKIRNIANLPGVCEELAKHGFEVRAPSELTFLEQVACFQEAQSVVGVLGSGLTGLLYSPYAVTLMTFAPPKFADRFFFGLTQMRNGHYVDLRGLVTDVDASHPNRDSKFEIDIAEIRRGLDALSLI